MQETLGQKIPWRRKWKPTSVFWPGKSHGQRTLVGYSPWGHKRVGHNRVTKQQQRWTKQSEFTKFIQQESSLSPSQPSHWSLPSWLEPEISALPDSTRGEHEECSLLFTSCEACKNSAASISPFGDKWSPGAQRGKLFGFASVGVCPDFLLSQCSHLFQQMQPDDSLETNGHLCSSLEVTQSWCLGCMQIGPSLNSLLIPKLMNEAMLRVGRSCQTLPKAKLLLTVFGSRVSFYDLSA